MIKAQLSPRVKIRAKIAGAKGELRLQSRTVIPSTKRLFLRPAEGYNGFDTVIVEGFPDANPVAFKAEQIVPDVLHAIGYNWFSQVVERTQEMVGTKRAMTPAEILFWLNRVKFIPQSSVYSDFLPSFTTSTSTRVPIVVRSTAGSTFTFSFESKAEV